MLCFLTRFLDRMSTRYPFSVLSAGPFSIVQNRRLRTLDRSLRWAKNRSTKTTTTQSLFRYKVSALSTSITLPICRQSREEPTHFYQCRCRIRIRCQRPAKEFGRPQERHHQTKHSQRRQANADQGAHNQGRNEHYSRVGRTYSQGRHFWRAVDVLVEIAEKEEGQGKGGEEEQEIQEVSN